MHLVSPSRRLPSYPAFGAAASRSAAAPNRFDWLTFALALAVALCVPAALSLSDWLSPNILLWITALLALVIGRILAGAPAAKSLSWLVGLLTGPAGVLIAMARPANAFPALASPVVLVFRSPAWRAAVWRALQVGGQNEILAVRSFAVGLRLWMAHGGTGDPAADQRVLLFLLAGLTWGVVFTFAWLAFRTRPPLLAILPPGAVAVTVAALSGHGAAVVYVFLAVGSLLIARLHASVLRRNWRQRQLRTTPRVAGQAWLSCAAVLAFAGVAAATLPALPHNAAAAAFWNGATPTWNRLQNRAAAAFLRSSVVGGGAGGDLTLGGPLSRQPSRPIMAVTLSGAGLASLPANGMRYFVGATYAAYTGQGWQAAQAVAISRTGVPLAADGSPEYLGVAASGASSLPLAANQPLFTPGRAALQVTQLVHVLAPSGTPVYAMNQALQVDQPTIARRTGAAVAQINLLHPLASYTVVSQEPDASVAALRAAGRAYPAGLAPYLASAPTTARVGHLARQWTTGAATPYDMAVAIQDELRRIPHTLAAPAPPTGRDPVDYFLFDSRQGYCEYYASAMVVMLRAVGVPARVATGYATNTIDPATHAYVITQNDAHAWAQVYFPGAGWVDFEPTPANPALTPAPAAPVATALALAPPARAPVLPAGVMPALPAAAGVTASAPLATLSVALLIVAALWRRGRPAESVDQVGRCYGRLLQLSAALGVPRRAEETPLEFAGRLAQTVRPTGAAAAQRLAALYVRRRYGGREGSQRDDRLAAAAWRAYRREALRATGRRLVTRVIPGPAAGRHGVV